MKGEEVRKKLLDNGFVLKQIAETLNMSPQAFNSKLNTKNVTLDTLNDIAKAINKNVDFFLSDLVEMGAKSVANLEFLQIPFVPIHAQGGYAKGYGDIEYIDSLPTIPVIVDKNYRGKYRVFEVEGDSMDDGSRNSICNGDKILCREVRHEFWTSKLHIKDWYFVLCMKNDGITVKQITSHEVSNGLVVCHPLNPIFEDFTVNLEDVAELFNVIKIVDRNTRI